MNICIFFLAQDLFSAPLNPDEDEFIETIPSSFSQAQELLKKGEIVDAKNRFRDYPGR